MAEGEIVEENKVKMFLWLFFFCNYELLVLSFEGEEWWVDDEGKQSMKQNKNGNQSRNNVR